MKVIEMFSGTCSFSKLFPKEDVITIDNNPKFNPTIVSDMLHVNFNNMYCDVLWASVPCTTFSIASCRKHWTPEKKPKSRECIKGLMLLEKTIRTIAILKPKYWFIENPRGIMRKVIEDLFVKYNILWTRETVCYCRYGDKRMKPTDIWHNSNWKPVGKMCHNGNPDHEPAPRGSKTGTQGLKGNEERSIIPKALCMEIKQALARDTQLKGGKNNK